MKAIKIVAIFIFGGLALFFILIMWRGMFRGTWSWWVGGTRVETGPDYKLVQEKELPAESIDSLEIRYRNFMSVIFYENSDDTILIREYLNFTPVINSSPKLRQREIPSPYRDQKPTSTPAPSFPHPMVIRRSGFPQKYMTPCRYRR